MTWWLFQRVRLEDVPQVTVVRLMILVVETILLKQSLLGQLAVVLVGLLLLLFFEFL